LKKNKLILSGLFLTTAISCSAYRPFVLTDAYIFPVITTEVDYEDINWSYALFNQYASGLTYKFRVNFSNYNLAIDNSIAILYDGITTPFTNWTTKTATFIEGSPDATFRTKLNNILFGRQFDLGSKKAITTDYLNITRRSLAFTVNYEVIIESAISYSVNIGSVYQAFRSTPNSFDQYYKFINFYDVNNNLLQSVFLDNDRTNINRNYVSDLGTIITNVRKFSLVFQWVDLPPFNTGGDADILMHEFNIFTQNQEISIPDDASGDRFGFSFVAVEWWNFLGHLQNFAWWIVNQSPVAPIFEWLDTYIIRWIVGLVDIIVGVFRL